MSALIWDKIEDRRYEAGVSHGVFYPDSGPGIVWNGLISVAETSVSKEHKEYILDGVKYLDSVGANEYQANVSAFSAPREFFVYGGNRSVIPGFRLTKQPKRQFNFSYQTPFGDGYKIHLVYNVLATPTSKSHSTVNQSITPSIITWLFDATPVVASGFKPSAHYVIDSNRADLETLSDFEDMLYGTESLDAEFPSISELVEMFS